MYMGKMDDWIAHMLFYALMFPGAPNYFIPQKTLF